MGQIEQALVRELEELLTVEEAGEDLFLGHRLKEDHGRIFGGEIIAQALAAATRTVSDDRTVHSLHAYFIRPGDIRVPAEYRVWRDRDGKSFSVRRVTASQHGEVILNLSCSFQRPEEGASHQRPMPNVLPPEELPTEFDLQQQWLDSVVESRKAWIGRPRPVEFRITNVEKWLRKGPQEPVQQSWVKIAAPVGDDPHLHRALLAWMSDTQLLGTCTLPHGLSWMRDELHDASLDHAIWFHDSFRADDWLLFDMDSPWSGGGRGLNFGRFFTRDGRLVASVSQEGMIRRKRS